MSNKMRRLPPLSRLKEIYSYDPYTQQLKRNHRMGPYKEGSIVTPYCNTNKHQYRRVIIDKQQYPYHRLKWLLHYGVDPYPYEVDHIDNDIQNNNINNLRLVNTQQNNQNRSLRSDNKSGYIGVFKRGNKWVSFIKHNNIRYHLGSFDSVNEAVHIRNNKGRELFGDYFNESVINNDIR